MFPISFLAVGFWPLAVGLLEQKLISLFYRNSRKAVPNPHQHGSETKFTAFCRFLLAARQSLRAVSALAPQRRFSKSFLHALLFREKAGSTA